MRERQRAHGGRFGSSGRWRVFVGGIVLAALGVPSLAFAHVVVKAVAPDSGFVQPYAGTPKFQQYAPVEAIDASEINKPIGAKEADRIARKLGLNKAHAFTAQAVCAVHQRQREGRQQVLRGPGRRKRPHLHEHHRETSLCRRQRHEDADGAEQLRPFRRQVRETDEPCEQCRTDEEGEHRPHTRDRVLGQVVQEERRRGFA